MAPACQARVVKTMEYASSDIRFDVSLAEACYEDRLAFCSTVEPGSARVIRCLQSRCAPPQVVEGCCVREGATHRPARWGGAVKGAATCTQRAGAPPRGAQQVPGQEGRPPQPGTSR